MTDTALQILNFVINAHNAVSVPDIADKFELSIRSVQRYTCRLEACDLVRFDRGIGGGDKRCGFVFALVKR